MSDSAVPKEVKAARLNGWAKTVAVVSVAVIGQLVQVRASDAQKLELVQANAQLLSKFDSIDSRLTQLSERLTRLEVLVSERTGKTK